MLRKTKSRRRVKKDVPDSYEIVEEEVVETLSDDDGGMGKQQRQYYEEEIIIDDDDDEYEEEIIDDEYEEEEILEEYIEVAVESPIKTAAVLSALPGISEEPENASQDDDDEEEYVEEDVDEMFNRSHASTDSMTEVEIDDEDIDEFNNNNNNRKNGGSGRFEEFVEEIIDESSEGSNTGLTLVQHNLMSVSIGNNNNNKVEVDVQTEDSSDDDEDDDGASAEELAEAIEYVLRQERAVQLFILTEEQAEKMKHLPVKVMKVIVDHFEYSDNEGTPVDWDFLLQIVNPFLESEMDSDDEGGGDQ